MLGDHSVVDPPDSMPNSEVKRNSADGSVGSPHVRVGHRQAFIIVIRIADNKHFQCTNLKMTICGEMAEWLKAPVLKTGDG